MELDNHSKYLRSLIIRGMRGGSRGHYGSAASLIEILRVIYDIKAPEDKVLLSKGHGCLALYAVLISKGIIPIEELDRFCQKDAMLGGHPAPHVPGVIAHTGALGHGTPIACGLALAARIKKQDHRIFVVVGDGELNEGSCWESFMTMDKHKLSNITVIVDYNKIQSSGRVEDIQPLEPLAEKFRAFGFHVRECDGHDLNAIKEELSWQTENPKCLIAHTVKNKGIDYAENNINYHYRGQISEDDFKKMEDALGYVA